MENLGDPSWKQQEPLQRRKVQLGPRHDQKSLRVSHLFSRRSWSPGRGERRTGLEENKHRCEGSWASPGPQQAFTDQSPCARRGCAAADPAEGSSGGGRSLWEYWKAAQAVRSKHQELTRFSEPSTHSGLRLWFFS